jgi:hypothetical protein
MTKRTDPNDQKRDEALNAIKRVEAESETLVGSTFVRMADRAKGHMSAADKDEDDRIEVWGTRIGRAAGAIFFVGLVIYLFVTYVLDK